MSEMTASAPMKSQVAVKRMVSIACVMRMVLSMFVLVATMVTRTICVYRFTTGRVASIAQILSFTSAIA